MTLALLQTHLKKQKKESVSWSKLQVKKVRAIIQTMGTISDVFLSTKSIGEHVAASRKVTDKVNSVHKSFDIPTFRYDYELIE